MAKANCVAHSPMHDIYRMPDLNTQTQTWFLIKLTQINYYVRLVFKIIIQYSPDPSLKKKTVFFTFGWITNVRLLDKKSALYTVEAVYLHPM